MQKKFSRVYFRHMESVQPKMFESQEGIERKNGEHVSKTKQNFTFYNINNYILIIFENTEGGPKYKTKIVYESRRFITRKKLFQLFYHLGG